MSIIDDFFVFGTSNLWNYPNYVAECLANESMVIDNVNPFDVCGNDRSDLDLYRCLEDGVFGNSIVEEDTAVIVDCSYTDSSVDAAGSHII